MTKVERVSWAVGVGAFVLTVTSILVNHRSLAHPEPVPGVDRRRTKDEAMLRASARFTVEDWRGAEREYDNAIVAEPEDWSTWHGRALARVGIGDFAAAIRDFDQAITLNQSMPKLYDHRGVAKAKLCRYQDAVVDFDRAIIMRPDDGGYHLHRAQALEHRGDLSGAQSDYERAVALIQPIDYLHQVASQRLSALKARRSRTYY